MYLYRSTGGCARCDAMEGYYPEEPARPHPNCRCEIGDEAVLTGSAHWRHKQWYSWDPTTRTVTYEIFVECCGEGGPAVQDIVEITFAFDPSPEENADAALEQMSAELEQAFAALELRCPNPDCDPQGEPNV